MNANANHFIFVISLILRFIDAQIIIDTNTLNGLQPPAENFQPHLPKFSSPNAYTSYVLGPVCTPSEPARHPSSVQQVIDIVQEAIERNTTVKAFGAKHSATDIICTNGVPVDMKGITGMQYHAENRTVTVGAGVYLRDLYLYLDSFGRGFNTIPIFAFITVGGALGTGAHGSTLKHKSSLSAQVVGMEVVDGLGQLRSITDEETLNAFRIHLGLLGIIVSVTLETVPLYKVQAHNYVISDKILTNEKALMTLAKEIDELTLHWYPSYGQVVVLNRTILPGNPTTIPGNAYSNPFTPMSSFLNWVGAAAMETAQALNLYAVLNAIQAFSLQSFSRQFPFAGPYYTEDGFTTADPGIGLYHHMYASVCSETGWNSCFWLHGPTYLSELANEVSIDANLLPSLVRDIKSILRETPALFPLQGIFLSFSGASTEYMSTNNGVESVHVEWLIPKRRDPYQTASTGIGAYQAIMQTMVKKYRGRSHWAKSGFHYHSKEVLDTKMPAPLKDKFLKKMKEFDPHGIFLNDFGRRFKGVGITMNLDPSTTHCALLDNCICSKDTDCASQQKCGKIHKFPVCLPV